MVGYVCHMDQKPRNLVVVKLVPPEKFVKQVHENMAKATVFVAETASAKHKLVLALDPVKGDLGF